MTFSIHQPNFIPWIGYFDKIAKSEVFIILDTVQYPRGKSVSNRNFIKSNNGDKVELVVPVSKPKGKDSKVTYREVNIAETKWQKKILKTLEYSYKKSRYFEEYFGYFESLFSMNDFCEMNISFINKIIELYEIDTKVYLLSDLKDIEGSKNDLIISIAKALNADTYLSGQGAKKYNDLDLYRENSIDLIYHEFSHPEYQQMGNEFVPHLSIVDLLFNEGVNGINVFRKRD